MRGFHGRYERLRNRPIPTKLVIELGKPSIVFLVNCFELYPNITSYHNILNIYIYHLIPCKHSKIWCSWVLECVYHYFSWILTASTSETWVSMGSKHHFSMEMETTFAKNIRWPARCDAESFGGGDIPRILLKHQFMNRGFTCFFVCKMYLFFTMMNWGQATKQNFVRV